MVQEMKSSPLRLRVVPGTSVEIIQNGITKHVDDHSGKGV